MTTKLFNKGKRTIHGTSQGKEYALGPNKAIMLDDAQAKKLRDLFPHEVISMEDVQSQFEETQVEEPVSEEQADVNKGKKRNRKDADSE